MLEVKLFGAGAARYFDRQMDGFPSQQSYQVLCYLLLNREHRQKRERLASIFWGNYATHASRKYLRNALWKLRSIFQSLGGEMEEYVQVDDETVVFQKSSSYHLDVETFENLLADSRNIAGENLNADQVKRLSQAVDLYQGDLLEGVDEEWCLYERERLSLMHLAALNKLMVYHHAQHNYANGLNYGERILAFDNTRENVHREMMQLHWLNGEQPEALAQYHRCAQILRDQIGVAPTEETRMLYEKMLHHRFEPRPDGIRVKTGRMADPSPVRTEELLGDALTRIQVLMKMMDETNQELRRLEAMVRAAQANQG